MIADLTTHQVRPGQEGAELDLPDVGPIPLLLLLVQVALQHLEPPRHRVPCLCCTCT